MMMLVHNVQWALSAPPQHQPVQYVWQEHIEYTLQSQSAEVARQENIPWVAWMHALGALKENFQTQLVLVSAQRAREENICHMKDRQLA